MLGNLNKRFLSYFHKNLGSYQRYAVNAKVGWACLPTDNKLVAFTLAEVLITLAIIGIVAAMTIPTLLQNQQRQATMTAVKKAYSTLCQAYTMVVQDEGTPAGWGLSATKWDQASNLVVNGYFAQKMKVLKNCGLANGCAPGVTYKYLKGDLWSYFDGDPNLSKFITTDGMIYYFEYDNVVGTPTSYGRWFVDTNGVKKPNQEGVDLFYFRLTENGIDFVRSNDYKEDCNIAQTLQGHGCTAWIILENNMDYLNK